MKQHHITVLATTVLAFSAFAQTVERVQLKDGQFTDWRKTTCSTRETKPGCTETAENITEAALEGQPAQTIQRTTSREKTDTGEVVRINETTRNALGKETGQRVVEETSQRQSDGTTSVRVVEQAPNRNGQLVVQREEQRRIREVSGTEFLIENQIRSYDHVRGQFDLTAIQTTEIRKQGDTTRTETTTRRTLGDADRLVSRVLVTETKSADGTSRRETVEYGSSLDGRMAQLSVGELKPQRKIIESTVQLPDGSSAVTREVFRLDVNGEWKAAPFNWARGQP
jgi:hypothetical protein